MCTPENPPHSRKEMGQNCRRTPAQTLAKVVAQDTVVPIPGRLQALVDIHVPAGNQRVTDLFMVPVMGTAFFLNQTQSLSTVPLQHPADHKDSTAEEDSGGKDNGCCVTPAARSAGAGNVQLQLCSSVRLGQIYWYFNPGSEQVLGQLFKRTAATWPFLPSP
ncbi:Helix-loop-helix DNA-binding domain [Musa troglodytarum]|nr:Helix-loop-helix DNA-binding domain [Musa troglodytarum]